MFTDFSNLDDNTEIKITAMVRTPLTPERVLGESESTYEIIFSVKDEYKVKHEVVSFLTKEAYEKVKSAVSNGEDMLLGDIVQELTEAVVIESTPSIKLVNREEGE